MSESSSDDDHLTVSVESLHGAESSDASASNNNKSAENYNQAVNRSKILVYIAILIAAAGVGTATWFILEEEEAVWYRDEVRMFRTLLKLRFLEKRRTHTLVTFSLT
jgi:hypothetical protein